MSRRAIILSSIMGGMVCLSLILMQDLAPSTRSFSTAETITASHIDFVFDNNNTFKSVGNTKVSPTIAAILSRCCSAKQREAFPTMLRQAKINSLGPIPLSASERKQVEFEAPNKLNPDQYADQGNGTSLTPYINAISNFIQNNGQDGLHIQIPPGYYQEANLLIPPGTWLKAMEKKTVLLALPQVDNLAKKPPRRSIITMSSNTKLIGFEIDGSGLPNLDGITLRPDATNITIAKNYVHNVTLQGMRGNKSNTSVQILGNDLRTIGYSGIRTGSQWLVKSNTISYAGIRRPDGGGGDDGIITNTKTQGSQILNNLVVSRKAPYGRHGMATQTSDRNLFQNNFIVIEGKMRGGLVLSDGSFENTVNGNVILGTLEQGRRTRLGILVNGGKNIIRDNIVVGFETGIFLYDKVKTPPRTKNIFSGNYIFSSHRGIKATPKKNVVKNNTSKSFKDDQTGSRVREVLIER